MDTFNQAFNDLKSMIDTHNKPLWFYTTEDAYKISQIRPDVVNIEKGTFAHLYDVDLNIIESIAAE